MAEKPKNNPMAIPKGMMSTVSHTEKEKDKKGSPKGSK